MIKEIRNMEDNILTGYEFNGMNVPLDSNNRFYKKIQKLVDDGEVIEPAFTEQDRLDYFKSKILSQINEIADKKNREAYNYIAGQKVSDLQVERYKLKLQKANEAIASGDYSYFELEADLKGITAKDLATLVQDAGNAWMNEVYAYTALIEAYRVKAKEICNATTSINKFKLMELFLAHSVDIDKFTELEIKALFSKYDELSNELDIGKSLDDLEPIEW